MSAEAPFVTAAMGPSDDVEPRSRPTKLVALLRRPSVVIALLVLLGFGVVAVFAPLLAPDNPNTQNPANGLQLPFWAVGGSLAHPLGTDELGRDLLSRLMYGARPALGLCFAASLTAAVFGTAMGLLAGMRRGWVGAGVMWLVDAQLAFPYIILALAVVTVAGSSFGVLYVLLSIFLWVQFARLVRAEVLRIRRADYVLAAESSGTSRSRIMTRHILPNIISPVIVMWTFSLAIVLLIESGLSFLGVGVQPPQADWGSLLETGRTYLFQDGWYSFFPGLAIFLTVLCVNIVGLAARDVLNPRDLGRR